MRSIYKSVAFFLLLTLVFSGCRAIDVSDRDFNVTPSTSVSSEEKEKAPGIPPVDTFLIPFEIFGNDLSTDSGVRVGGTFLSVVARIALGERSNWNHALFNVGFWNAIVRVGLAVPVAAFVASFQNIPLKQPDGSWEWSYDVRVDGVVYSAKLIGKYIDQDVRWEMYISRENGFQDFLWYYGENNETYTEGFWILKNNPSEQDDLLRIDWSKGTDEVSAVRYTNVLPGGPENGGYIDVRHTPSSTYDYIWDIFNKGRDNHTIIEWSSLTKKGKVKDPVKFSDEKWHCWDENKLNTECP